MNGLRNMGRLDRLVRGLAGAVLVLVGVLTAASGLVAAVLYIVGGALMVTAMAGFCPAYLPFGIRTDHRRRRHHHHTPHHA